MKYEGSPCTKCGGTIRYRCNRQCISCSYDHVVARRRTDEPLLALPNDIRVMVLTEAELLQQRPNLILARICRDYYNRKKREHGG